MRVGFEDVKEKETAETILMKLFNTYEEVPDEASTSISPSGLACQVSMAFKVRGLPRANARDSFQSRSFAENGEDRHARIQEFLSKTEYWVDPAEYVEKNKVDLELIEKSGYEVLFFSKKYNVRFRCDGILFIDGVYYILEIKTERESATISREGPADKHQRQGISYSLLLGIKNLLWLYEGRDMFDKKIFVQPISDLERTSMAKFLLDIETYKNEPEKLERDTKLCTSCPYKEYCRNYFKELKKAGKLNG